MTTIICATPAAVADPLDDILRRTTIFRRLAANDRRRLAGVGAVRAFDKGVYLFREGDDSDHLYTILSGRVKVFIRIMSRWGKQGLVHTDKDGFLIADQAALETIALS